MPQGKLKAKAKVPASVAKKKAKAAKGPGISRKSKPITPKKAKSQEIEKIKKAVTKNVHEAIEEELRGRANNTTPKVAAPKVAAPKAKTPKAKKATPKKKAKKASPKKKAAKK